MPKIFYNIGLVILYLFFIVNLEVEFLTIISVRKSLPKPLYFAFLFVCTILFVVFTYGTFIGEVNRVGIMIFYSIIIASEVWLLSLLPRMM